jgi:putative transposase
VKFRFMDAERASFPLVLMCRVLDVARSGFYAWKRRPVSARKLRSDLLAVQIRDVHREHRSCYGAPRVKEALALRGIYTSKKRVAQLMRREGLKGKKAFRNTKTTASNEAHAAAPNLLNRNFTVSGPNKVWLADATAIWTLQGWLYLATVMDLYSRRIVGWAVGSTLSAELCIAALERAIDDRRPAPGLLHHSDRGCTYTSADYQAVLRRCEAITSMSRRGNCWDNAPMESFFGTLKIELDLIGRGYLNNREQGRAVLFEYIETFYNRKRLHSVLRYCSPAQYEEAPHEMGRAA